MQWRGKGWWGASVFSSSCSSLSRRPACIRGVLSAPRRRHSFLVCVCVCSTLFGVMHLRVLVARARGCSRMQQQHGGGGLVPYARFAPSSACRECGVKETRVLPTVFLRLFCEIKYILHCTRSRAVVWRGARHAQPNALLLFVSLSRTVASDMRRRREWVHPPLSFRAPPVDFSRISYLRGDQTTPCYFGRSPQLFSDAAALRRAERSVLERDFAPRFMTPAFEQSGGMVCSLMQLDLIYSWFWIGRFLHDFCGSQIVVL